MALNNVRIVSGGGDVKTVPVDDRTTSSDTQIYPGDPVKKSNASYVAHVATAEPDATHPMYGIAQSYSTETSTAEGTVDVQYVIPGVTILEATATTPANLAASVLFDCVTFTLSGTTYTINEDEGDDPNDHGLEIISYDAATGKVQFKVKPYASEFTCAI